MYREVRQHPDVEHVLDVLDHSVGNSFLRTYLGSAMAHGEPARRRSFLAFIASFRMEDVDDENEPLARLLTDGACLVPRQGVTVDRHAIDLAERFIGSRCDGASSEGGETSFRRDVDADLLAICLSLGARSRDHSYVILTRSSRLRHARNAVSDLSPFSPRVLSPASLAFSLAMVPGSKYGLQSLGQILFDDAFQRLVLSASDEARYQPRLGRRLSQHRQTKGPELETTVDRRLLRDRRRAS